MRKLALAPLAAAAALYAPIPLTAQTGGGATALVPVSEVPTGGTDGAVEAPSAAPAPEPAPAPTPAPEEAPQLVPPEEMAAAPDAPAAAPAPEPQAAAALVEVSQLPDEEPAGEDPTPPVDPTPDRDETDPEEFEEEFDDPEPPADTGGLPSAPRAVPAAARLPETGNDVAPLAGIGMSLLLVGGSLRRVRPARR